MHGILVCQRTPSWFHSLVDTAVASVAGGRRAAAGERQSQGCRRRRTRAQEEGKNSSVEPMVGGNDLKASKAKALLQTATVSHHFEFHLAQTSCASQLLAWVVYLP
jgi:hypothetical protein